MAWYREIEMLQEPFDMGLDDTKRVRFAFNIEAIKSYSTTFEEEISKLLTDAGVGTFATSIFIGSAASIPTGVGPYLSIVATPGMRPERTHNEIATPAAQRPSAQLVTMATSYVAAKTMALAAYAALVGVRNRTVTP
jgi:hypothetical protein